MSYSTPHHIRDYVHGACLEINHAYCLQCTGWTDPERQALLASTKEIDLCARLGQYFGTSTRLHAQGSSKADLRTDSPRFEIEVKYIFPKRTNWSELSRDWRWLRDLDNNGGVFAKRAMVWFWPSIDLYEFTQCVSVTRDHGDHYSEERLTPFWPYVNVETFASSARHKLVFAEPLHQGPHLLRIPNGRRFRIDIVGSVHHPLWASVITRLTPTECDAFGDEKIWTLRAGPYRLDEWEH